MGGILGGPSPTSMHPGPSVGPSFTPAGGAPQFHPPVMPGGAPWVGGPGPSVQPNFNPAFTQQTKQKAPPIRPPFLPPGPQMMTSSQGAPTGSPRLDSLKPSAWGKRPGQY